MASRLGLSVFAAVVAIAVALAVLAAPAAAASRSDVNWKETWKVNGVPVLTFKVTSVSVGNTKWSARISFRNLLHRAVNIPRNSFGIAFYASSKLTASTPPEAYGLAKTFSKPRPLKLAAGRTWSGVISGLGRPAISGKAWVRIVFGPFSGIPGTSKLSLWVTDHALVLTFGSKSTKPGGPLVI
ncbi:MAG TPA: hypothetical protein VFA88_08265 [Gaiellaceae bacterium]|nr:hypothetical protein [Gaiellaceae bacterium]